MKPTNLIYSILVSIALLVFSFACNKDSTSTTQPITTTGLNCTVNGINWKASTSQVSSTVDTVNKLVLFKAKIPKSSGDTTVFSIQMKLPLSLGNHTITGFYDFSYYPTLDSLFTASENSVITITKFDLTTKKIEGTFNNITLNYPSTGTLSLKKTVTNGSFGSEFKYGVYLIFPLQ